MSYTQYSALARRRDVMDTLSVDIRLKFGQRYYNNM